MYLVRFFFSGLLNTGLSYLLYLFFLQLFSYQAAYTGAFVMGILISYGLNAKFVFRSTVDMGSLNKFIVLYLTQYFMGLELLIVLIDYVDVSTWIAPLFVVAVTVPVTFIFSRYIFTKKKMETDYVS